MKAFSIVFWLALLCMEPVRIAAATGDSFGAESTVGGGKNKSPINPAARDYVLNACGAQFTPIYEIQGNGANAAITGNVTTRGVVVGDYEGAPPALRGFYIQDAEGDGDLSTSDGIFVFNANRNSVKLGDLVRVTGTAGEFQGQTQISAASIEICTTGTVNPVDVRLPFPNKDYPERFEGMLVRLPQSLSVTETFRLGRFGEVGLASGGRLRQPTDRTVPGPEALRLQNHNNRNRILIDDALQNQNPDPIPFGRGGKPLSAANTLRGGDTATDIVGVMTYTWAGNSASGNAFRVRPVQALNGSIQFKASNARPVSAPKVGGNIRIAAMNLLNFFNTFDGLPDTVNNCTGGLSGPRMDCRGADTSSEFERQYRKTVAAILALNPDILGVNELENDGYGPDSAIRFLVNSLNAATRPGTYAFIDVDANSGELDAMGSNTIKIALLYKPAVVRPVGQTAVLNTDAFVNAGDRSPRNRPSLAQAFEHNVNRERFIVNVNHLKSKASRCDAPDAGDGQGHCNQVRVIAATELMHWLASDPTGTGDPDILLLGDYNAYTMEDPIARIESSGFRHLSKFFEVSPGYSYGFDGQWGSLDHALASSSMLPMVRGAGSYHINADEPSVLDYNTDFKTTRLQNILYAPNQFRSSDHDPVVVGLCTPPALRVSLSSNRLWPANHNYQTVETTLNASRDSTSVVLLSATSNEADSGLGQGDLPNDIVIVDKDTFRLRAERSDNGAGRIYTLTYRANNTCGATVTAVATVRVPRT